MQIIMMNDDNQRIYRVTYEYKNEYTIAG